MKNYPLIWGLAHFSKLIYRYAERDKVELKALCLRFSTSFSERL